MKINTNALSISMMAGNALFTVALVLGAFSGTYAPAVPYAIWGMAAAFLVFSVLFFAQFKTFGRLLKVSGSLFAVASSILGVFLGGLSSVTVPEGQEGSLNAVTFIALLGLGTLLFLSFYQTYFLLARLNGQFLFGASYLGALSLILIFAGSQGNVFALNLGITSLMVTAAALLLDRRNPVI